MAILSRLKFGISPIFTVEKKTTDGSTADVDKKLTEIVKSDSLIDAVINFKHTDETKVGLTTSKGDFWQVIKNPNVVSIISLPINKILEGPIKINYQSFEQIRKTFLNIDYQELIDLLNLYVKNTDSNNKNIYENFFNSMISNNLSNESVIEILLLLYNEYISLIYLNNNYNYYYNNIKLFYYIFTNSFGDRENHVTKLIKSAIYGDTENKYSYKNKENIDSEMYRLCMSCFNSEENINNFLAFIDKYTTENSETIHSINDKKIDASIFLRLNDSLSYCDKHIDFFSFLYNYSKGLYLTEQKLIRKKINGNDSNSEYIRSYLNNTNNPFLMQLGIEINSSDSDTINAVDKEFTEHSEEFRNLMTEISRKIIS